MSSGRVVSIHTAPASGAPMTDRDEVTAIAGVGLEGDRYAIAAGTYSGRRIADEQRAITLVAQEVLDALAADHGIGLTGRETRRNVVTAGVALNDLVGRTFRVGAVELRGVDLAHPCAYLEEATGKPGVLRALAGNGGLRAEILTGGPLRVGDAVTVDPAEASATP